jgi:hypothetical protein
LSATVSISVRSLTIRSPHAFRQSAFGNGHSGRPETPARQIGSISPAISHDDDRRRRGPENGDAKKDNQGDIDEVIKGFGDPFAGRDAWSDWTEQ